MITLLDHSEGAYSSRVTVLLDVTANDFGSVPEDLEHLFTQAHTSNRKVGLIERQVGGDTFFTFDPGNQMQLEVALIAAFAVPKSAIHVERSTGAYDHV